MKTRRWCIMISGVFVVLMALAPVPAFDRLGDLQPRLAALDGSAAEPYLLLAEEIAAEAVGDADVELARQLGVRAVEIASGGPYARHTAASAMLLLVELEPAGPRRAELLSILTQIEPDAPIERLIGATRNRTDDANRLRAAIAVGAARSGEGHRARQLLEDPRVAETLERFAGVYAPAGGRPLASYLADLAVDWPCPVCSNDGARRAPRAGAGQARRDLELCPNCYGDPGPQLFGNARVALLRLEASLLAGDVTAWSRRLNASDAPARAVSVDDLAVLFGIDPGATIYRDGAWRRP